MVKTLIKSSIYINDLKNNEINFKKLNGKDLSYNNYNDMFASLDILFSNFNLPTTVIVKHANPCGFHQVNLLCNHLSMHN